MTIDPDSNSQSQDALRRDLIARLLACLADADRLGDGAEAAIEISLAIHRLGGKAPAPVEAAPTSTVVSIDQPGRPRPSDSSPDSHP